MRKKIKRFDDGGTVEDYYDIAGGDVTTGFPEDTGTGDWDPSIPADTGTGDWADFIDPNASTLPHTPDGGVDWAKLGKEQIDKVLGYFKDSSGNVDWTKVLKTVGTVGGAYLGYKDATSGSGSGTTGGYQGGIPALTLSREKNAIPTDRRPGAGGIAYFSPARYLGQTNMGPFPAGGTAGSTTTAPIGGTGTGGTTSGGAGTGTTTGGIGSIGGTGASAGTTGGIATLPATVNGSGEGMWVQGKYYTAQQIKDAFNTPGFDPNRFAQEQGITNLDQIHQLATQARTIAGSANPTGEAALRRAWEAYKQYNPGGAGVGSYESFVANIPANRRDAIMAGTYSGAFNDMRDYAPGGIYGPGTAYAAQGTPYSVAGLGSRGDGAQGNAWNVPGLSAAPAPAAQTPPSVTDIASYIAQHARDANFATEAQKAMQQYGLTADAVRSMLASAPNQQATLNMFNAGMSGAGSILANAGIGGAPAPTQAQQAPLPQIPNQLNPQLNNWQQYINQYQDLQNAGINSQEAAQQHWQQYGQNEGRQWFASGGPVGGIAALAPAKGRLLNGPGDGVSDSIPATINGKEPAALADGEFVVPARAVSELGNGSTKAGARKLYAMLDRIEQTRHSNKATAKDTKADRHLPA